MSATVAPLSEIRSAIKQSGARWTADETSVSRMPEQARRALLLPGRPVRKDAFMSRLAGPVRLLPKSFDWRNVAGRNYVTPVKNQVGGTCVAFANTAALESCVLRAEFVEGNDIDLSERVLAECNPGYPSVVAEFLQSTGLPPDRCFSYTSGAGGPSEGWQDQAYRVIRHGPYRNVRIEEFKSLIVHDGPVVAGMNVPSDFYNYKGGVYFATTTSTAGFHEVLAIGYDDNSQCFLAKNSWGEDWGEEGLFRIAYRHFADNVVGFGYLSDTFAGVIPPRRRTMSVPVAVKTINGNTLTIVNGGGLGGTAPCALHTDAVTAGPWETFVLDWLDSTHFTLRTANEHYVTAVNGGGVGGPNDASSPVHTDASWVGPWEELTLNYDSTSKQATIQTPNGRYLTAVNGGGFGGPNNVPIHTDATAVGPWEKFTAQIIH